MRVILHLGMGKTGSTSIQKFLEKNADGLVENQIFYAGLMFERLPNARFEWQDKNKAHDISIFLSALRDKSKCELIRCYLNEEIALLRNLGFKTMLVSNEAFFDAPADFHDFLYSVLGQYDIKAVVYLRRPSDWYVSAYLQWGIKHKTYKGRIKPFDEFVIDRKNYFQSNVEKIKGSWRVGLHIRRYEEGMDVLSDFLSLDNLLVDDVKIKVKRENQKESTCVVFLRYLVNDVVDSICLPERFDKMFESDSGKLGSLKSFEDYLLDFKNLIVINKRAELTELVNNELCYWAKCTDADVFLGVDDLEEYLVSALKMTFNDFEKEELFRYLFRYFCISLIRENDKK